MPYSFSSEPQAPLPEGLDHLEVQRADRHVHPVETQLAVGPDGGVPAPHVDDGEGFGRAQVGIDAHARHHQEVPGVS